VTFPTEAQMVAAIRQKANNAHYFTDIDQLPSHVGYLVYWKEDD
jgi:hypothetical protein